jgi:hypothetical protein
MARECAYAYRAQTEEITGENRLSPSQHSPHHQHRDIQQESRQLGTLSLAFHHFPSKDSPGALKDPESHTHTILREQLTQTPFYKCREDSRQD